MNKKRSLSSTVFSTMLIFTLCIVVAVLFAVGALCYFSYEDDAENNLVRLTRTVAAEVNTLDTTPQSTEAGIPDEQGVEISTGDESSQSAENLASIASQLDENVRCTLIDPSGNVLFDSSGVHGTSDAGTPNHYDRPEVQQALKAGESSVMRYSSTLQEDSLYVAVLLDDGSVLRLSETRETLMAQLGSLFLPGVAMLVIIVFAIALISQLLTRRIMRPLDSLNIAAPADSTVYREMEPLVARIDEQQTRLREQNRELARAESMRRDFSSNVSHELKSPLQVISGYAEIIKGGTATEEDTHAFAEIIYDESQNMQSLINDVLVLSRIDESVLKEESAAPVDMLEVAQHVAGRLLPLAQQQDVAVAVDGAHAVIRGNRELLEEMTANLISNAICYNREGGFVQITVTEETHGADTVPISEANMPARGHACQNADEQIGGKFLIMTVEDSGIGIPPDEQGKIFERFYRVDKSRSKETGGTGLGLAIAKHAALYHGGTISVESQLGKGSTFTVSLPVGP